MPEPPMTPSTDLVMRPPCWPTIASSERRVANGERKISCSPTAGFYSLFATRHSLTHTNEGPRFGALCQPASPDRDSVHRRPHLLLGEVEQAGEHDQEDHHLEAEALARLEVRLGRPHQECSNVLGVLVDRLRRTVGV